MKNIDAIVARAPKLLNDPNVQRSVGAAGTALAVAGKGVIVAAAPYVGAVAIGAAVGYGAVKGICWIADRLSNG